MIYGIGTDIVATRRMADIHARHGDRLASHLLAEAEREDFARAPDKVRFLAKRFAAKEALGKALGTGIRVPMTLTAVAVVHDGLGRPEFAPTEALAVWLRERGAGALHLTLSDEQDYAVAFVVVERP
ncbi:MAG: holo-ACP synthase [Pseudomonadota bacterium]